VFSSLVELKKRGRLSGRTEEAGGGSLVELKKQEEGEMFVLQDVSMRNGVSHYVKLSIMQSGNNVDWA
jgi:hypothetical protein